MPEAEDDTCLIDCEGLYADVEFEKATNNENVRDRLVL